MSKYEHWFDTEPDVRECLITLIDGAHGMIDAEIIEHTGPCDHEYCESHPGDECQRASTAREYFNEVRGYDDATIERRKLGWIPPDPDGGTFEWLQDEGFSEETIRKTGAFMRGSTPSPLQQGRYTFPYFVDGDVSFMIARCTGKKGGGHEFAGYDGHSSDMMSGKYAKLRRPYNRDSNDDAPPFDVDVPVRETIFGVDSIERGQPLCICGGITDAIALIEAGYACLSPVTTVRFKGDHQERVLDLIEAYDIPDIYIINDRERASVDCGALGSIQTEATDLGDEPAADSITGANALNIEQFGEGLRGAFDNARFMIENDIDPLLVNLPNANGSLRKIDPDDFFAEGWGELDHLLACAKPASQNPKYAEYNETHSTAVDGSVSDSDHESNMQDASGSVGAPFDDPDEVSDLFTLSVSDITGLSWNYRGVNPIEHHGNSRNYTVLVSHYNIVYDYKDRVGYNPLTLLLCLMGDRDRADPHGELTDNELLNTWMYAKREGHIPEDDPIPRRALIAVAIEHCGCTDADIEDGWRLPRDAHDDSLRVLRDEYGVEPGIEELGSGVTEPVTVDDEQPDGPAEQTDRDDTPDETDTETEDVTAAELLIEQTDRVFDGETQTVTVRDTTDYTEDELVEAFESGELPDDITSKVLFCDNDAVQSHLQSWNATPDEWEIKRYSDTQTTESSSEFWTDRIGREMAMWREENDNPMPKSEARHRSSIYAQDDYHLFAPENRDDDPDKAKLYVYNDDYGYYEMRGKTTIREDAAGRIGRFSTSDHGEIAELIKSQTWVERDDLDGSRGDHHLVNLENGTYDMQAGVIRDHDPADMFRSSLPIKYDSDAQCPHIETFIEQITPTQAAKETIFEYIGFCLTNGYPIHRFLMIYGPGGNGKGVLLRLIKEFLGTENASSVTLSQMTHDDGFMLAQLDGKMVNIDGDVPGSTIDANELDKIKKLTGGDSIPVQNKYETPFDLDNHAKLIFAANEPPRFEDETSALSRRLLPIEFPYRFTWDDDGHKDARDESEMMAEMTTDKELAGLFNRAVAAYARVEERSQYKFSIESNGTARERYDQYRREAASPTEKFIAQALEPNPQRAVPKGALYDTYARYCRENGFIPVDTNVFFKTVYDSEFGDQIEERRPKIDLDTTDAMQPRVLYGVWVREAGLGHMPREHRSDLSTLMDERFPDGNVEIEIDGE